MALRRSGFSEFENQKWCKFYKKCKTFMRNGSKEGGGLGHRGTDLTPGTPSVGSFLLNVAHFWQNCHHFWVVKSKKTSSLNNHFYLIITINKFFFLLVTKTNIAWLDLCSLKWLFGEVAFQILRAKNDANSTKSVKHSWKMGPQRVGAWGPGAQSSPPPTLRRLIFIECCTLLTELSTFLGLEI